MSDRHMNMLTGHHSIDIWLVEKVIYKKGTEEAEAYKPHINSEVTSIRIPPVTSTFIVIEDVS